jgi:hypothetical protein
VVDKEGVGTLGNITKLLLFMLPGMLMLTGCTEDGLPSTDTEMICVTIIVIAGFAVIGYVAKKILE